MDSEGDAVKEDSEQVRENLPETSPSMSASASTISASMPQEKSDDAVPSSSRGIEVRRQPLRKARMRKNCHIKRKSGFMSGSCTDSNLSSDSETENPNSMDVFDKEIDSRLEENASKNKLNAINVKNILREVLTNEEVVSMLRNSLQFPTTETDRLSPEPATYELRMTRSKVKKVLTEEKAPKPWPTSPEERPTFLDLEFPDDEEDDEYKPEEEHLDEEKEVETEVPTLQIDDATEEEPNVEGSDIIATRTRSKLPMTGTRLEEIEEAFVAPDITADMYETECDDSEWQDFLAGLIKTDPVLTSVEAVEEDPNDPDFNYLAAPENEDDEEEDFKFEHFDKPFRVSKMEVNQLIDDLREWFPDDEEELVPLESKSPKKKMAPVEKGTPKVQATSSPTKDIAPSPDIIEEETFQEQPDSSLPVLSEEQRETLKAQLQQHVQLTSQLFVLSLSDRLFWENSEKSKRILMELDALQRISPARHLSVYRACPLKEAVDLTATLMENDWVKKRPPAHTGKKKAKYYTGRHRLRKFQNDAFLTSPVFLYAHLLPERGFCLEFDRRLEFRHSEDMLIALALEQINALELDNKYELVHLYWIPSKDASQISKRVTNVGQAKCSSSPLTHFRKNACAPPCECKMQPRQPVAPKDQAIDSLPEHWRRLAKEKAASNVMKKRKRSRSISSSRTNPKRGKSSETTPKVLSAPNSPNVTSDDSCPEPLDLASLIGLPLPELKRPEQRTPEKKTPQNTTYVSIAPRPGDPSSSQTSAPSRHKNFLPRIRRRSRKARPSPKKTLIFPKNYTVDHKSISPTKRAALSVVKKAQHTYQRTSPCKIAISPRNWASYAKSLGRVSTPVFTVTATTASASASQPGCKMASGSPRGRPRKKEKPVVRMQEAAENEQSDDMLEEAGKDDENEQNQDDDTFHLDQLMAASTTIQFDPRKGHGSSSASRPTRHQRRKDLKLTLLSGDLLETDPKRGERDETFAKEYLNKVRQALMVDADLYVKFLQKMADFGQGLLTPVELYDIVKEYLKDHPDLVEDFMNFLSPSEAAECNCFLANSDFTLAQTFLRKLELCFEKQPTQFQKILKVFADWNGNRDKSPDVLRDLLKPFLRHLPYIADDLTMFFSNEKPPEPLMSEFETMVLTDEALAAKHIEEVEEIDFPDETDTYRFSQCPCQCHNDVNDQKYHERIRHCLKCSLKVIYGKVFFQFSQKRLVPACITYFDHLSDEEASDSNKEDVDNPRNAPTSNRVDIPRNTSFSNRTSAVNSSASHKSRPLKKMKIKLTGAKAQSKEFVALSEVLVSPSKVPDGGSRVEKVAAGRSRARVITETIPQYPNLNSTLEMQPTALSEESSGHGGFPRDTDTADGAGLSLPRKHTAPEGLQTSSVQSTGTRSGPRVILKIADGTSKVILRDSEVEGTPEAGNSMWKQPTTESSLPEMMVIPSLTADWINNSPSKSQEHSDLLSKAMKQAMISKSDADFSVDESLFESLFQQPDSQLLFPAQTLTGDTRMQTRAPVSVTSAQGCSLQPSATTTATGMDNLGLGFQEGQGSVKGDGASQTPESTSTSSPAWTREVDKLILETCKASGVEPETFLVLEKILPEFSADQLQRRLTYLLELMEM